MPLPRTFNKGSRLATVGLELGICVAIGAVLGLWLDQKFGTKPYLSILGLLLGVLAGGRILFAAVHQAMRENGKVAARPESSTGPPLASDEEQPACEDGEQIKPALEGD